jgi:mannose-6-phosphate isomerase-like protein (cupin superfamily)
MQLKKEGVIGYHQTTVPQLMVIVEGEGKVRGKKEGYTKIKAGQAVLWAKDEWHETKSADGMSALVIESEEMTCHITELFDYIN